MKILHTMAGGEAGGAEMAYVDLLIAQKQAGMDVIAACRPNATRVPLLKEEGIKVYELPFGGFFDRTTRKGLKNLIADEQPDIVQCWMSRAAKLTPKVEGIPKLARLGGYYKPKYFRNVDHFIGIAPDICRWISDEFGVDRNNIHLINNFAEAEPIEHDLKKTDLQTHEKQFAFLILSRLHHAKAIDTALFALQKTPEAVLWIAGDGPDEQKLKSLSHQLGVEDRVRWLGWRTDRSALLKACDAVLFPSRHEPFGTVFVQAWLAKKPLVTTASQGPSQYVTDGENALMTPVDDVDALSGSMLAVMQDRPLARKLVRNGTLAYENQFKRKVILGHYKDLYEALLRPNPT